MLQISYVLVVYMYLVRSFMMGLWICDLASGLGVSVWFLSFWWFEFWVVSFYLHCFWFSGVLFARRGCVWGNWFLIVCWRVGIIQNFIFRGLVYRSVYFQSTFSIFVVLRFDFGVPRGFGFRFYGVEAVLSV